MDPSSSSLVLPARIQDKFDTIEADMKGLIAQAERLIVKPKYRGFSFAYKASLPRDLLTDDERAQSVCFVTRYAALPTRVVLEIGEQQGKFFIANIGQLRHALNEFRTVLVNETDSLYYGNIHKFCRQKLVNTDPSKDLQISVLNEDKQDVTAEFVAFLDQTTKAMRKVITGCEFDYIYNGILQHSDHSFTQRYLDDYASGEINYVFLKHTLPLEFLKSSLYWHHQMINMLTYPVLGPL